MKTFKKHPSAAQNFPVDFTLQLAAGETLSSVGTITANPSGDLTFPASAIAGSVVNVKVAGGGTGKIYVVTCPVLTSAGQTLEGQILVSVDDPVG